MSSFGAGCGPVRGFDSRLKSITGPYIFSIAKWEFGTLFHESRTIISGGHAEVDNDSALVTDYFSTAERIKDIKSEIRVITAGEKPGDISVLEQELDRLQQQNAALAGTAERIIENQLRETLFQQGIYNPAHKYLRLKSGFPPVDFRLERPPYILVVSPRDRIESMREITLKQDIDMETAGNIEADVDELGVSSLVVELGGFAGTYPSLVTGGGNLRFTLDTAAEEWLHQYLAFKPLGFRYILDLTGISRNYEIATMNEALAGMVSKEIGSIVYQEYYAGSEEDGAGQTPPGASGFDFNREMREIRRAVDGYLARGEIEQAEAFMEQRRQYLASNGYHIRKLNQAYFAFYGTYADSPTSISPIGRDLKELRSRSDSLKDFLEKVAQMTSRQDLEASVK